MEKSAGESRTKRITDLCAALSLGKGKVTRRLEREDSKGNIAPASLKLPLMEGKLTVSPMIECVTYYATKEDEPVHWLLVNGHHDAEHAEYGNKMVKE